uniref:DUF1768 domain-containing protein n=2 Tax=Meloidogyne hapla TaxID=6305 RepID=A0A1I8BJU0_MELHA
MLEQFKITSPSKKRMCIKTTPLIKVLCEFNGGCVPEILNCEIRKNYKENLQFIQSLTSMSGENVAKAGIGQKDFTKNNITPGKKSIVTNHLKNRMLEVYPNNFTSMGSDRTFALRGYLSITIRSTEQYFVWQKARFFGDYEIASEVLTLDNPLAIKRVGHRVRNFNKDEWDSVQDKIMYTGLWAKFTQNTQLFNQLRATGKWTHYSSMCFRFILE